jgi:uncharacterized membrane protein YkoI
MKSIMGLGAGFILAVAGCASNSEKEDMASAPAAVQATAKRVLGDRKSEGFDKEDYEGKPAYELTYKVDGVDHSALIAENGELLEEEVDVDLSKVPTPVTSAAMKAHADGKVKEAAIVTASGKQFYELDVIVGKDTHEMKFNTDGSIVSDSVEKPESGEKKEGKEDKD